MKKKSKKKPSKIEIRVAIITGLFAIAVALIGIFPDLFKKSKPEKETKNEPRLEEVIKEKEKPKTLKSTEKPKINAAPKKEYIELEETIMFKGKVLKNAYFSIRKCKSCQSTVSGIDGKATVSVPKYIFESDKEFDFDVYVEDTLLYHRSMKFSNISLNKY